MAELEIPEGNFEAILFDCDGTVADSMPLHFRAWKKALAPYSCPFDRARLYAWAGRPAQVIIDALNEEYQLNIPVQETAKIRDHYYLELLPEIKPISSVLRQVQNYYKKLPLAIVSGGSRESIFKTLGILKLEHYFDVFITAEDVKRHKPHPDPFLEAARRLNVNPEVCLVFEDADLGIESAKRAGMKWVKVPIYESD